jgi:hypothetical protein
MINLSRTGPSLKLPTAPIVRRRRKMGDPLITLNPNVNVNPNVQVQAPINIELGSLPLSIGLFAGSGILLLIQGAVPKGWPKTTSLIAGLALATGGILNLVWPRKSNTPGAPAPTPTPAPSSGVPISSAQPTAPGGGASSSGYSASDSMAFENVTGRISYPADFSSVDIGPLASSYPVRVQLNNPTEVPTTFELELSAEEDPHPFGSTAYSSLPVQVNLAPREVKDVDLNMPISSWSAFVTSVDIALTARKRRVPGEDAQLLDQRGFVIK